MKYKDTGLLIGQTQSGKSTLAKFLIMNYFYRYRTPEKGWERPRILVLDTKPRWRGTKTARGDATRLYNRMVPGDMLPAVVLQDMRDWDLVWDPAFNLTGIVVVQGKDHGSKSDLALQVEAATAFYNTMYYRQPSFIYVDEGHDFYGPTGMAKYGDVLQRCWRAGKEQGITALMGVQRPKVINLQLLTESNVMYLFHIAYEEDLSRLREMGVPKTLQTSPPMYSYRFRFFKDGMLYPLPVRIGVS